MKIRPEKHSGLIFTTAQVVFITAKITFIFTSLSAVQIYLSYIHSRLEERVYPIPRANFVSWRRVLLVTSQWKGSFQIVFVARCCTILPSYNTPMNYGFNTWFS